MIVCSAIVLLTGGSEAMNSLRNLCPISLLGWAKRLVALTIAVVGLFPANGNAQLSSASVTGVVRDSSGSVVASVKLSLTNLDTTVKHSALSNSVGNYVFLNITPGNYSLEATAPGFQTTQIPRFTLAVNQTATIDVALQVGAVQQTLTVEAAGELLQQSTAELGAVIAEKQVDRKRT